MQRGLTRPAIASPLTTTKSPLTTMKKYLILLLTLAQTISQAQDLSQSIRGRVIDKDSKSPLIGVNVVIISATSATPVGSVTDIHGYYKIENVSLGRHALRFSYIGYKEIVLNDILVTSGKEVILDLELEESVHSLEEVVIKASADGEAFNEMAIVSARSFSIEETDRYAGSRGDPARMASNFAGVQGADDSRNDIVIRGNSPQGVLWQLEGINIPNPNHFSIPGTAGGPVSILNNKILGNSDFYTGAFPAEFGNSIAGVFDLKMRNGNNEKYEFSGQFGFLGTELFAEGPISRANKSSFLASYRYSTLSLFGGLGIKIGTDAIPNYQDAAFRLNFPLKNGGNLSFFGVGGLSNIEILISDQKTPQPNIYGENDRDQHFGSRMGITGLSYSKSINTNSFIKASVAASTEQVIADHYFVERRLVNDEFIVDSLPHILDYTFTQDKYSGVMSFYHKVDNKNSLTAGVNTDLYNFHFVDSVRFVTSDEPRYSPWRTRWNSRQAALLLQAYFQWKHKFNDNLTLTGGLHSQYFSLSNSLSAVEPRLGLKWQMDEEQSLSFGYGLHSQIMPPYLYFYSPAEQNSPYNTEVGFLKSHHFGFGYDRKLGNASRLKSEIYYQNLYDVPVEKNPSSVSFVNTGAGFTRFFPDTLVNEGTGFNYGIELTLERFFSKGYFFMVTGSLFESKYRGSDNVLRDTDFNGNYAFNGLLTKEFESGNNSIFSIGGKVTLAGGRRYGPVDEEESAQQREVVFIDATRNSLQFKPYFRLDTRISYRLNRPKVSHEIALDLVNVINYRNILKLTYIPDPDGGDVGSVRKDYQLGFLPIFYYKIDF